MGLLADLIVRISTTGGDALKKTLDSTDAGLKAVAASVDRVGNLLKAAFALDKIGHLVSAGIAASSMGDRLNISTERLSRTLAGLFSPEINKAIELLNKGANWIDHLSASQKQLTAHLLEGASAFGVVSAMFGPLAGLLAGGVVGTVGLGGIGRAIEPLIGKVQQLGSKLADAFTPLAPVLEETLSVLEPLLSATAELAEGLASALEPALETVGELVNTLAIAITGAIQLFARWAEQLGKWALGFKGFTGSWREFNQELAKRLGVQLAPIQHEAPGNRDAAIRKAGGFEDVQETYRRIAAASVKLGAGKSPEEQTAENTGEIKREAKGLRGDIQRLKPAVRE